MNVVDDRRVRVEADSDEQVAVPARVVPGLVSRKIQACHRERLAVVYVRQSTPQQLLENRQSTARQYALADDAVALGWPAPRVLVIDEDQGRSGRSAEGRSGFQRLLTEVALEHVGIVLGLEMSRLARSSKDWHHLIELCAIFGTLLGDQDGIYDPADANDRLLLGLKGTMSEMELHTLRNRLERGKRHKAQQGELFVNLPMGYVRLADDHVALDPDEQVRASVRLLFDKFSELGGVNALMRYLVRHGIRLGMRRRHGPRLGELEWRRPRLSTLFGILHNPIYAGAYVYGRCMTPRQLPAPGRKRPRSVRLPPERWQVLLRDRLPAYISWEQYQDNQQRLQQNRMSMTSMGPPRCGAALLAGLVRCGRCGSRLHVFYYAGRPPQYRCVRHRREGIGTSCVNLRASAVDALVARQVLRAVEPAALELSLQAAAQLERERQRLTQQRQLPLERARYEANRAEHQYRAVDPENRLVAAALEKSWEQALCQRRHLEEEERRHAEAAAVPLSDDERTRIQDLAAHVPALWEVADQPQRKEIVRCLVEQVVLNVPGDDDQVEATLHWHGGWISRHTLRRPVQSYEQLHDRDQLLQRVVELRRAGTSAAAIAGIVNREGFRPPKLRDTFTAAMISQLLSRQRLTQGCQDTLKPGESQLNDLARRLSVKVGTLRSWAAYGWINARHGPISGRWILWADPDEIVRLGRLRDHHLARPFATYPADLTTPKKKTEDSP